MLVPLGDEVPVHAEQAAALMAPSKVAPVHRTPSVTGRFARATRPVATVHGISVSLGIQAGNHRRKPTLSSRGHQPVIGGRRFGPAVRTGQGRGEPHRHMYYTRRGPPEGTTQSGIRWPKL